MMSDDKNQEHLPGIYSSYPKKMEFQNSVHAAKYWILGCGDFSVPCWLPLLSLSKVFMDLNYNSN